MFRTRVEVWESLKESFATALFFMGFGAVVTGLMMGFAILHQLECTH
jgi:hypothetical protein